MDVVTVSGSATASLDTSKKGGAVEGTAAIASASGRLEGGGSAVTTTICAGCATGGASGGVNPQTGTVSGGVSASTGAFGGGISVEITAQRTAPPPKPVIKETCGSCSIQ